MPDLRVFTDDQLQVSYGEARALIRSGDVLLWEPTTLMGRMIARGTRRVIGRKASFNRPISHASMAGWEPNGARNPDRRLRNVEMVQFAGGRHQLLSDCVRRHSGKIHVFRPLEPYDGQAALAWMLWLCSQRYGWINFAMMYTRRVLRWKLPMPADSPEPDLPRVCSTGVAWAAHYGGGRKVDAKRPDMMILPAELAAPDFARYVLTPTWDETCEALDAAA